MADATSLDATKTTHPFSIYLLSARAREQAQLEIFVALQGFTIISPRCVAADNEMVLSYSQKKTVYFFSRMIIAFVLFSFSASCDFFFF
jgi:hypothetical protein